MTPSVVDLGSLRIEVGTLAQWFAGMATLAAVLWAMFSQWFLLWFRRPRLDIAPIAKRPQDCVSVPFRIGAPTIHLRFRVVNHGRSPARNAQVYADTLERADGTYWVPVETFPSMNLWWADRADLPSGVMPWLPQNEYRRCDLGHIMDPTWRRNPGLLAEGEVNPDLDLPDEKVSFTFATVGKPNHRGYIVPPGTYRLFVSLSAENAAPRRAPIILTVHGPWYKDPNEMMERGFDIEVGPPVWRGAQG
jgi:hypothetical protein